MRFWRAFCLGVLALPLLSANAHAGWQNVFQVTCFGRSAPAVSNYADPCCNPCPQQCCTTRYVQRSYYQPVTTYESRSYYEPVTTYRTSYYYEPVTSYRYSCYYDPCTCSYRQVATPCTSYRLRSQCCPVQSWVQRCCSVPVTTYKQYCYYEPQTSCSYVDPCHSNNAAATYIPPANTPAVTENQTPPGPGVQEYRNPGTGSKLYDQYNRPAVPAENNQLDGNNSSYRYRTQFTPNPLPRPATRPTVTPRQDRITSSGGGWTPSVRLTGHVLPE